MSTTQNNKTTFSRLQVTANPVPDGTSELPAAMPGYNPPPTRETDSVVPALPGE